MKLGLIILTTVLGCVSLAIENSPFTNFYGSYEIKNCKKISSENNPTDWCNKMTLSIGNSLPNVSYQDGITFVQFFNPKEKMISDAFRSWGNPKLKPEYYKNEKDEEGFEHYFSRIAFDQLSYDEYKDFWLKRSEDGSVICKYRKKEVSQTGGKIKSSFEYEFLLKPLK